MSDQLSLPGFAEEIKPKPASTAKKRMVRKEAYNLFFAIFPDSIAADRIAQQTADWRSKHDLKGKLVKRERLHVSLHGLGIYENLPPALIERARQIGSAMVASTFEITFDRALSFGGGAFVLAGDQGTAELKVFRRDLGELLRQQGLSVSQHFKPHMTLLYDDRIVAEHAIEPIRFDVNDFALINSHQGKSFYEELGRWPLGLALPVKMSINT